MVRWASKPSLRAASCCSVEVVKGGGGLRLVGLASTEATVKSAALIAASAARARFSSPMVRRVIFSPSNRVSFDAIS
jgi:hypothetical protein